MSLSPFIDNIIVYIAGWVVRAVIKRLKCVNWIEVLTQDAVANREGGLLLTLRDNGGLLHASDDVLTVVTTAEKVLRSSVDLKQPGHRCTIGLKLEMQVISKTFRPSPVCL